MDRLTRQDLERLASAEESPCVTIYMPLNRTGAENQEERIHLKNRLKEAVEQLIELGLRRPEAEKLMAFGDNLINDPRLWQQQGDGLAIFRNKDLLLAYRLPVRFEPSMTVGHRFDLKPLMRLFTGDGRFFVLALSFDDARLIEATRDSQREVPVRNWPESLSAMMAREVPERGQFAAASKPRPPRYDKGSLAWHGYGSDTDGKVRSKMLEYMKFVADALQPILRDERAPLVVATVEYLYPLFRQRCDYNHIVDDFIEGNPEQWRPDELREKAWPIVEPIFDRARREALADFQQLMGQQGRASDDLGEIIRQAQYGLVSVLFVPRDQRLWGALDGGGAPEGHTEPKPGDRDLYDAAAVQTVLHGGRVYVLSPDDLPDSQPAAGAIFRYSW